MIDLIKWVINYIIYSILMQLLKELCGVHAPSGQEQPMKEYLLAYVEKHGKSWKNEPEVIHGKEIQDCLMLKFADPKIAIFVHMDSTGFTVRYQNQLVAIGQPEVKNGYVLLGEDSLGPIKCKLQLDKNYHLFYEFGRYIERGTSLVFDSKFKETKDFVQSCYLDNRLGVYIILKLCETLDQGIIAFTCWEEHGGGSVPYLIKYMYKNFGIVQSLICDITWITEGIRHGKGVVISLRDRGIPRKAYVDKIIKIAHDHHIPYQLEVEGSGGSDGLELQRSPYPIDWCFVGAPEENVHAPNEMVHKKDIQSMLSLYQILMKEL